MGKGQVIDSGHVLCVRGLVLSVEGFYSLSRASAVLVSFCCSRELLLYSRASAVVASFFCTRELLLYSRASSAFASVDCMGRPPSETM